MTLHDAADRAQLEQRVRNLRPDSTRQWGKMSVDQMLWHVSEAMEVALGTRTPAKQKPPLPHALFKFIVIHVPWPKGTPTLPTFVPTRNYEFTAERDRCLALIEQLAQKKIDAPWPESPVFGPVSGRDVSRLQAKHLNHHLTQFGV